MDKFITSLAIIGIVAMGSFVATKSTNKIYYVNNSVRVGDSYKTYLEDEDGNLNMVKTDKSMQDIWLRGNGIKWRFGTKELVLDLTKLPEEEQN